MKRTLFLVLACSLFFFVSCDTKTVQPEQEDVRGPFIGDFTFYAQDGFNSAGGTAPSYQNNSNWEGTITKGDDINVLIFTYEDSTVKSFTVDVDGNLTSLNGRESGTIEPDGDYFYKNTSYSPVGYFYNSLSGVRQ